MAPNDRTTVACEDDASYLRLLSIHPGNIYNPGWSDSTTPRTERPAKFVPRPHFWKKLAILPASYVYRPQ